MINDHTWPHIGIFGPSCVGKTTLAGALGNRLSLKIRSCGDELRRLGTGRAVAVVNENEDDHRNRRAIDAASVEIVQSTSQIFVLEGRFLDAVIGSMPNVLLIALTCTIDERIRRYIAAKPGRAGSIQQEDEADRIVRQTIYTHTPAVISPLVLDTTSSSVTELTESVLIVLREHIGQ